MTTEIQKLIKEYTQLTKRETNELAKLVSEYAEEEELVYEIIGMLESGVSFSDIKKDLKNCRFGFDTVFFREYQKADIHENAILENPPEIREGELECPVCKQKKTVVVEMQTRSADEGFTYKTHCFNPKCRAVT